MAIQGRLFRYTVLEPLFKIACFTFLSLALVERMRLDSFFTSLQLVCLLLISVNAHAYIGPGLGAGTIGVVLGLVGSIFLALFAFFWYPIKRMLFSKKDVDEDEFEETTPAISEGSPQSERTPEDQ